jgi:hypothetical protein
MEAKRGLLRGRCISAGNASLIGEVVTPVVAVVAVAAVAAVLSLEVEASCEVYKECCDGHCPLR